MAVTAEELNIILQVRDEKFAKQMKKNEAVIRRFGNNGSKQMDKFGRSYSNMGRSVGAQRAALQNASFQVQDIITQISMGTSATRALSVQLPQLLGGFGAFGAALGVAVGALGFLAPNLLDSADAAEELEANLKSLAGAMDALQAAQSQLDAGISSLADGFGRYSEEAAGLLAIQREIATIAAQQALGSALGNIGDQFGEFNFGASPEMILNRAETIATLQARFEEIQDVLAGVTELTAEQTAALEDEASVIAELVPELNKMDRTLVDLGKSLGITTDEARTVAAAIVEMQQAEGVTAQAEAAERLAQTLDEVTGGMENADEATRELYNQLLQATLQGLELSAIDYASNISAGADEAGRLADNLMAVAQNKAIAAAAGLTGSATGPDDAIGQLQAQGRLGGTLTGVVSRTGVNRPKATSTRSGGGGGGASQRDPLADLQRQLELDRQLLGASEARARVMRRLADDAAQYNETEINSLIARIEAYNNEAAALEDIRQQQQDIADTIEGSMTDAFTSIVDGTKSTEEAFKDMARSIIAQLYRVLVVQNLVGSFNAQTGSGSGLAGAIGKGIAGIFSRGAASGRAVQAGSPFMVGEHGREPFIPAQNGRILSVAQAKSAMGGGGGVVVHQTNHYMVDVEQTVRAQLQSFAPKLIEASASAVSDKSRRSPAFRSAF